MSFLVVWLRIGASDSLLALFPYFPSTLSLLGGAEFLRPDELQARGGVVAVNLLHIELAHELDGFGRDDLARAP